MLTSADKRRPSVNSLRIAIFSKNEDAATVGGVIDGILERYESGIVVLVVNDDTEPMRALAREKGIRIFKDSGKGKGAAIRETIDAAGSDILVLVDADGSHDTRDIPALAEPILQDTADMVVASRLKGGSEEFSGSLENYLHLAGNYAGSFMVTLLWRKFSEGLVDCFNGFRAVRTDVAKRLMLREDGFAIELEMVIACCRKGYRLREVPSREFKRKTGRSQVKMFSNFIRCSLCIARNGFPLRSSRQRGAGAKSGDFSSPAPL